MSKKYGGLGMRSCSLWNIYAVGKYVCQVSYKVDILWIKWVHNVYIKDVDWWGYKPPQAAS